ncbi:hypothetical protein BV898_11206 [Hypsibius exemplaris]|uniref:Uncharacterized protein n=1 Tax=Hypsibius exemplaris TaxID=2072580 RepID=A0A1W0WHC5_HYPEX|nr:hypothetical protein BV898_11206 [Hypsibius exemplaris]
MTMLSTASQPKRTKGQHDPYGLYDECAKRQFSGRSTVNNASSVELLMERKNFKLQQIYNLAEAVKTLRENERLQARSDDIIVSGF